MLTENEMDAIAEKYINEESSGTSHEFVLIKKSQIKKEYGKIYYYNTKKFIETSEFEYALVGNAPFPRGKNNRENNCIWYFTAQRILY